MNARVTLPIQTSYRVFGLIVIILLLSVLVNLMNHPNYSISMHSSKKDPISVFTSASQAKPRAVPVPTPPANTTSLRSAAATPVPAFTQPIPVPQPVPTPPSGR